MKHSAGQTVMGGFGCLKEEMGPAGLSVESPPAETGSGTVRLGTMGILGTPGCLEPAGWAEGSRN